MKWQLRKSDHPLEIGETFLAVFDHALRIETKCQQQASFKSFGAGHFLRTTKAREIKWEFREKNTKKKNRFRIRINNMSVNFTAVLKKKTNIEVKIWT